MIDDAVRGDDEFVGHRARHVAALPAAMSTITLPGFMLATISSVISSGAGRPGISAVVMMMSTSGACSAYISAARAVEVLAHLRA